LAPNAKFGTIRKDYRNATMPYTPSEMVGTERKGIFGISESEINTICTSHVERNNLTIRTLLKRFTRLSLGFSKKLENLQAACSMFFAFYNFVWRTREPEGGRLRLPAAMLAGVTDRLWSFEDLFDAVAG
jgi:IS1 transposase